LSKDLPSGTWTSGRPDLTSPTELPTKRVGIFEERREKKDEKYIDQRRKLAFW
jgi:hypothetical protein